MSSTTWSTIFSLPREKFCLIKKIVYAKIFKFKNQIIPIEYKEQNDRQQNFKQYKLLHFAEHDTEEYYIVQLACNILTDSPQLQLPLQQRNAHMNFDGTSDM